jgi:hypothetical protein
MFIAYKCLLIYMRLWKENKDKIKKIEVKCECKPILGKQDYI